IGRAGIEQAMKGRVRGMPGQVVVIACVMIAGAAAAVADRTNDGQMVGLPGEERQGLAQPDARGTGHDGAEGATVLCGGVRFHIPGVDVRCPAREPDHDGRLRDLSPPRACLAGCCTHSEETESPGDEERTPVHGMMPRKNPHRLAPYYLQASSLSSIL